MEPTPDDVRVLYEYVKKIANVISALRNDLEFMINGNLDANNIRAKSITANKMKVDELSAISADLGHITAGLIEAVTIIGSEIMTSQNTYPRVELSALNDLVGAFQSAGNSIRLVPTSGPGTPAILFDLLGATNAILQLAGTSIGLTSSGTTNISLQSANNISLSPLGNLTINDTPGWSGSYNVVYAVDFINQAAYTKTIRVNKGIVTSVS